MSPAGKFCVKNVDRCPWGGEGTESIALASTYSTLSLLDNFVTRFALKRANRVELETRIFPIVTREQDARASNGGGGEGGRRG
jgi:hypothetical protein